VMWFVFVYVWFTRNILKCDVQLACATQHSIPAKPSQFQNHKVCKTNNLMCI
jgi:hypothetical protein